MTQKLQNSIANGYSVNIGAYLSRGLDIMKQNMGGYIGYAFLGGLISLIVNFIPLLNILAGIIITPCLLFGYHLVSNNISAKNVIPPFGEFFSGFNHFGKIVVVGLLGAVVYIILFLPLIFVVGTGVIGSIFSASSSGNPTAITEAMTGLFAGSAAIILMVTFLAVIYVSVSLMFAGMIAVFHNEEPVNALTLSWKVINKNWLMWFVFAILFGIILSFSILLLFVGLFFAFPFYYCSLYAAFEDVCGVPETDGDRYKEISTIGAGLV